MEKIIDHKLIKPQTNWVLVRANDPIERYHLNGKETSIIVGTSAMKYDDPYDSLDFSQSETVDTQANHWPILGEVIAVPKKNVFYGHEISRKMSNAGSEGLTPELITNLQKQSEASIKCRTDVEINVGDVAIFDYMTTLISAQNGLMYSTDIGDLMLINYSMLIGKMSDKKITPLNGNIFFEWDNKMKLNNFVLEKDEIHEAEGVQTGIITHVGSDPRYYLDNVDLIDIPTEFNIGEKIYFEPYACTPIEAKEHLHIFEGKQIFTISRKDILLKE